MVDFRNANVLVAAIVGAVLLLVGLVGFVTEPVLIVFGINALHNVVHLATGAILLAAAFAANGHYAKVTNITLGVVYAAVALLGFAGILVPQLLNMDADLIPHADNLLHSLLAVVLVATGLMAPAAHEEMTTRPRTV